MANTYTQLLIHGVFAVKYRQSLIDKIRKDELHGFIGSAINRLGHKTHLVNGVEDHVHILFGMKPNVSISDTMRDLKANSSRWINESGKLMYRFEWQIGYGAFAISKTHFDAVFKYIEEQEEHHKDTSFREEYLTLLKKNDVEYDEQWIFDELADIT